MLHGNNRSYDFLSAGKKDAPNQFQMANEHRNLKKRDRFRQRRH